MTPYRPTRRALVLTGAAATAALVTGSGLVTAARAAGVAPTPSMRGGANNYLPGAPIVKRIGGGGVWMSGTVRRAGDGAPLEGVRIQIWAHTTEGHERDPHSHGATLTRADGTFRLEMPQINPASSNMVKRAAGEAKPNERVKATLLKKYKSNLQSMKL